MNDNTLFTPLTDDEAAEQVGGFGPIVIGLIMLVVGECIHYSHEFVAGFKAGSKACPV